MKIISTLALITLIIFILFMNYQHPIIVEFDNKMVEIFGENAFVKFFHIFGETKVIIAVSVLALLVLWLKERNYRAMLFVLLTVAGGNVLNKIIKTIVARPRPEMEGQLTSFSFPSGHGMIGLLYIFTITYLISEYSSNKKFNFIIWIIAVILAIFTGLSRIAGNHHYASDVVAGWSLGFTWFIVCVVWYEARKRKLKRLEH